ncbi:hypothetical protein ACMFMG_006414 [Clarireedia jacksonii]
MSLDVHTMRDMEPSPENLGKLTFSCSLLCTDGIDRGQGINSTCTNVAVSNLNFPMDQDLSFLPDAFTPMSVTHNQSYNNVDGEHIQRELPKKRLVKKKACRKRRHCKSATGAGVQKPEGSRPVMEAIRRARRGKQTRREARCEALLEGITDAESHELPAGASAHSENVRKKRRARRALRRESAAFCALLGRMSLAEKPSGGGFHDGCG